MQKQCAAREELKLEFDALSRSLRKYREKSKSDPAKAAAKEAKLTAVTDRLNHATTTLYANIRAAQSYRDTHLLPQLKRVSAPTSSALCCGCR